MKAIQKIYKIHNQEVSKEQSVKYDWSNQSYSEGKTRIIEVINTDKHGIDGLTIVKITRDSAEECDDEFNGQMSDGLFEGNFRYYDDYKIDDVVEVKEVNI